MNKAAKITVAATAILAAAIALLKGASKIKNLNQKFKASAGVPNDISLKNGNLSFNLPIDINNQSSFDVTLQNVYVTIQNKDANGYFEDLFTQSNGIKEVLIKQLVTSRLGTIPLSTSLVNSVKIANIIGGKSSSEFKIIVRFDLFGFELDPIEFIINGKELLEPFKRTLNMFGFLNGLGYASNNFHYRKIKPATAYLHLMPKSKGLESVISVDAEPEKTVKHMAKIVKETLWQTKDLAKVLQGDDLRQSCKNVYDFLYNHIQYKRDEDNREQLREPIASFASRATGIDCDCFSIFASSLLTNMGINHDIKVISVNVDKQFQHVYVTVPKGTNNDKYFTIDPCLHSFDEEAKNITRFILEPMYTTRLSGLNSSQNNEAKPLQINGLEGFFPAILTAKQMADKVAAVAKVTQNASTKVLTDAGVSVAVQNANLVKANDVINPVLDRGLKPNIVIADVVHPVQRAFNAESKVAVNPNGHLVSNTQPSVVINNYVGGGKTCTPKPTPQVRIGAGTGKSIGEIGDVQQIRRFTDEELFHLSNVALQPAYNMVKELYVKTTTDPGTISQMYNVIPLRAALADLLAVWNEPTKRNNLIDSLAAKDFMFIKPNGLSGLNAAKAFPIYGLDGLGNLGVSTAKGGFFTSLRSMVKSVEDNITANARNAENYVKTVIAKGDVSGLGWGWSDVTNAVKKATSAVGGAIADGAKAVGGAVAQAAGFVMDNVQKYNPIMVLARTTFRGLVAINMRGWASDMASMISAGKEGALKDKWIGPLVGGNWGDLVASINMGKSAPKLLKGLGEPVTAATAGAAVVTASPVIALITGLIAAVGVGVKLNNDGKDAVNDVIEVFDPSNPNGSSVRWSGGDGGAVVSTPTGQGVPLPQEAKSSNTTLYVALAVLAASGIGYGIYASNKPKPSVKPIGELNAYKKAKKAVKTVSTAKI